MVYIKTISVLMPLCGIFFAISLQITWYMFVQKLCTSELILWKPAGKWKPYLMKNSPLHSVIKHFYEFCVKSVKEILPQNPQVPGCLNSQLHEAKNPSEHKKRIPSRLSKTGISGWGLQTLHSQNRNLNLDPSCSQVT